MVGSSRNRTSGECNNAAVNSIFGGQAPFGGPLVAGQISQAPELEARGLPGGHGNLDFGLQTAVGAELRLNRNCSGGFDARWAMLGRVRLLRGAAYERLGRRAEAREQYRQVLAQWKAADPALQPFIQQAQRGLARVGHAG